MKLLPLYFKSEPFQRYCLAVLLKGLRWLRARTDLTFEGGSRFCNNVLLGVSELVTCEMHDLMIFNASHALCLEGRFFLRFDWTWCDYLTVWHRARRGGMLYRYNKLFLHDDTAFSLPE